MEDYDKTYMWMTAVSFIALLVAVAFGWAEITDIKNYDVVAATSTASSPSAPSTPATATPAAH